MKFTKQSTSTGTVFLANDHYTAKPYDCTSLTSLATGGIIPAGTLIPANDATAEGVLLSDVHLSRNPNGTIVTHGFVLTDKLPKEPDVKAVAALKQITFVGFVAPETENETETVESEQ